MKMHLVFVLGAKNLVRVCSRVSKPVLGLFQGTKTHAEFFPVVENPAGVCFHNQNAS